MIKGSVPEENITIINIVCNLCDATQHRNNSSGKMLTAIKREINSSTIIVGNFNTPLIPIKRQSRQKINKETQALNDILNQIELIDIYRTFYPRVAEYTFFSSAHGIFSRIDHILSHRSNFGKFKKVEITWSLFSDHNAMRSEINYEKKL